MIRTLFFIALTVLTVYSRAAEYNVLDFGAKNNGRDLTTFEIQKAIDKCHSEGGGCVFVPAGEYLVGTLNLKSNVEFHFETGAVLKATTDLSQYQKNVSSNSRHSYLGRRALLSGNTRSNPSAES